MERWGQGELPRRMPIVIGDMPEYLKHFIAHVQKYKFKAQVVWQAQFSTETMAEGARKGVAAVIYHQLRHQCYLKPYDESLKEKIGTLQYQIEDGVTQHKKRWFGDKRIPHSLHEVRWRAYHRVLRAAETEPWQMQSELLCKRPGCVDRTLGLIPTETVRHMVHECPTSKQLWRVVAWRLKDPTLALQSYEQIISGKEQVTVTSVPLWAKEQVAISWTTKRLINLIIISRIERMRKWQLQSNTRDTNKKDKWSWGYCGVSMDVFQKEKTDQKDIFRPPENPSAQSVKDHTLHLMETEQPVTEQQTEEKMEDLSFVSNLLSVDLPSVPILAGLLPPPPNCGSDQIILPSVSSEVRDTTEMDLVSLSEAQNLQSADALCQGHHPADTPNENPQQEVEDEELLSAYYEATNAYADEQT
uniref:Uncharacterized protein n=1 Tax=Sphaerodactylus townsendi TaxID=933632 RepID=A0ACB8FEZ5_9SAUR